jgi:hypothetical protein
VFWDGERKKNPTGSTRLLFLYFLFLPLFCCIHVVRIEIGNTVLACTPQWQFLDIDAQLYTSIGAQPNTRNKKKKKKAMTSVVSLETM